MESQLQSYILWLDSMHESMAPRAFVSHAWEVSSKQKPGGALNKALGRRGQYATSFLLQTVMFAMHLRNAAALSVSLRKAFALLPPVWRNLVQESLTLISLPSAATVSRAKLFLDVTYMLYMRGHLKALLDAGSVFYLLCDSSPQRNQNWEMMEWYGVKGSCMLEVFQTFQEQMKLKHVPLAEITREQLQEAVGRADVIRDAQIHHILPPVALGVRRATILHKIHAILHGIRLEAANFGQAQLLLDNTLSITADLGTESDLVQVHHAHYRRFFIQCCLDEPQMQGWDFLFDDGPPLFEGGRAWGVLSEGVAWLLRRETVLRRTWVPSKMARSHAEVEAADPEGQQAGREDTSVLVSC